MKSTKAEKRIIFGGIFAVVITLLLCTGICIAVSLSEGKNGGKTDVKLAEAARVEKEVLEKDKLASSESLEIPEEKTEASEEEKAFEPLVIEKETSLYTYEQMEQDLQNMALRYDDISIDSLGETMDGRQIYHVLIGNPQASRHVMITGSIHAREYITTQLVMKQMNEFLKDEAAREKYLGQVAIHVVPMINPDGVAISQMGLNGVKRPETRSYITDVIMKKDGSDGGESYFARWKANARGVDINRNFDALWEQYVGSGHPSSDHYKGETPGSEPEAVALISLTEKYPFVRTVSYHSQGEVIYWYFAQTGKLKTDTERFATQISALTGYRLDDNYQNLDPAGYKDWAISKKKIPSLTIEVGRETSPVPSAQFGEIWNKNSRVWNAVCDSALEP